MRLILALLVVLTVPASAQQRRAMTPDDIMTMKNVSDAQISPDGKWVAYVVSAAELKESVFNTDIWLVPAAGGAPLRLTSSPKADGQPRWSPDGKTIAFVSAREERGQIWQISPFGGEAEKLTDSKSGVPEFSVEPGRVEDRLRGAPRSDAGGRAADQGEGRRPGSRQELPDDPASGCTRSPPKKATEIVKDELQVGDVQWSPDGTQDRLLRDAHTQGRRRQPLRHLHRPGRRRHAAEAAREPGPRRGTAVVARRPDHRLPVAEQRASDHRADHHASDSRRRRHAARSADRVSLPAGPGDLVARRQDHCLHRVGPHHEPALHGAGHGGHAEAALRHPRRDGQSDVLEGRNRPRVRAQRYPESPRRARRAGDRRITSREGHRPESAGEGAGARPLRSDQVEEQ